MNDYPVTRRARPGDPHLRLRLAALIAVIAGVVLVAAAAFLLSYAGIHQIALHAGVSPRLARLYPLMFDAMLVVTCAAVLALRNAGWGTKFYVWACLLLVLAAVAVGDALHATGIQLTGQAARAAIAVIPWVLLLMGFGIWLMMLRQWRRARAAAATSAGGTVNAAESSQAGGERPAIEAPAAAAAGAGAVTWAVGRSAAPDRPGPGGPGVGIDALLQRNAGQAPDRTATETTPAGAPAPGQEQRQRTSEPGQDRPAAETAPAAAAGAIGAGAAVSAVGAAGTRQNGATTAGARSQGRGRKANGDDTGRKDNSEDRGRKDNGEDAGRRTRLGGLLKVPDSKPDEEGEEGSVRLLPADPRAPAEGTDTGNSHADGAGAQAGDAAKARDAAHTGNGAQTGDTTHTRNGAKTGDAAHTGNGAKTGDTAHTRNGAQAGDTAHAGDGAKAGDAAQTGEATKTGDAADGAGDGAKTGDATDGAGVGAGPVSPPLPAAAMAPHFDRLRSSPTPPGETGTGGE